MIALIAIPILTSCQKTEDAFLNEHAPETNDMLSTTFLPDSTAKESSYKIAIFTDLHTYEAETISILKAEEQYKERIVKYIAAYDSVNEILEQEDLTGDALHFIADPEIKVFIFVAGGYMKEPANFLKMLKEIRPNIFYIVAYCYSPFLLASIDENQFFEYVDLKLSINQEATAIKAVKQAKKMGAMACIDYSSPDRRYNMTELELRMLPKIRSVLEAESAIQNIKYIEEYCPEIYSDIGGYRLIYWPMSDMEEKYSEYGNDICGFSNNCLFQMKLDEFASYSFNKGIVVQLCHPGLFHNKRYSSHRSLLMYIIDSEKHFGDLEWTIEKLKEHLKSEKTTGRFATWRVPFSMVATTAAVEYAINYCEGNLDSKVDLDAMRECFQNAMEMYNAGDIEFELNRDAEHDNHIMFTQDYIIF